MLDVRIYSPTELTDTVVGILQDEPTVSNIAVVRGASLQPEGDLVFAALARETANEVIDRLRASGIHNSGTIQVEPVHTWVSRAGFESERVAPGADSDAVVWAEVVQRAYDESQLSITYLAFISFATLIASVGIILDSQILIIGAMVLGPEFGAIASLGIALVRRRPQLLAQACRTLVIGFAVAITITFLVALIGRGIGWLDVSDVAGSRPSTSFIYRPDQWALIVALIAGSAGVLSMASGRAGGLVGVFISVTTIPAAGNIALSLATANWFEFRGSSLQLVLNIIGMAFSGWLTLVIYDQVWRRVAQRRLKRLHGV